MKDPLRELTSTELAELDLPSLVERMDKLIAAPYANRRTFEIMKLGVRDLMETQRVRSFPADFQRKVAHKAFRLLFQLIATHFAVTARFQEFSSDASETEQLHSATRDQWTVVSSRMAFECFMELLYMLREGEPFKAGKSRFKTFRKWLKLPDNAYSYFAISAARAFHFDRDKRTPEVHAGSKIARRVLELAATSIDNSVFELVNILKNQWQFVVELADSKTPNGWVASGGASGDREWYELWERRNQSEIAAEIDRLFKID